MDPIHVFYACDDIFAPYMIVSMKSLLENRSKTRSYVIHVLNTDISDEIRKTAHDMEENAVEIRFEDVSEYIKVLDGKLPIRDYYTKTTYYRLFIADMFPDYDKVIYLDSDTIVLGDISELYDTDVSDYYVAAAHEQAMVQEEAYGKYVEDVCGIDRNAYFNAGVLLINTKAFREARILKKFTELLKLYNFRVTQDEDYLNVLCKDRVKFLHSGWDAEVFGEFPCREDEIKILHYIMTSKPWHYRDCRFSEYFWNYAKTTPVYDRIVKELENYTDEQRENDLRSCERLMQLAIDESARDDSFYKTELKYRDPDRVAVTEKIRELEKARIFDVDVENDPPTKPLKGKVDYTRKKLSSKIKTAISFFIAKCYVESLIDNNKFLFKGVEGIENMSALDSGAIITCNHFNAYDSFAINMAYYASKQKKRKFFRVIREGNYTNFPGFYGILMRNCNTLPLSASFTHMKRFSESVDTLLTNGHFVLFYPEQSMWWNYRKPRPLKPGAYRFAARNSVPVLPAFITLRDSDRIGDDGFPVQEYTVHICKPIYPDVNKSVAENARNMRDENAAVWKDIYEKVYGIPLSYI